MRSYHSSNFKVEFYRLGSSWTWMVRSHFTKESQHDVFFEQISVLQANSQSKVKTLYSLCAFSYYVVELKTETKNKYFSWFNSRLRRDGLLHAVITCTHTNTHTRRKSLTLILSWTLMRCRFFAPYSLSLSLSLTHTHTLTHTVFVWYAYVGGGGRLE
jgi:hypothetical protein